MGAVAMVYNLHDKLVIGVASSALFDLEESDAYFREHGEEAYRLFQAERVDDTLQPGIAFPLVRRLLSLNDLRPANPLVEVIILSANDPSTGLRVMRSVQTRGLPITRSVFMQGRSPYEYIEAFEMSLFLSADGEHVREALRLGHPAGQVLPSMSIDDDDPAVRIAFDFDGVLADDTAERVYQAEGLDEYRRSEAELVDTPLDGGPLNALLRDLTTIQKHESERAGSDASYELRLRISIVTARSAPAHERAIRTLEAWGIRVNDAFFLGGIDKGKVLGVLKPHVFFDDQTTHLKSAAQHVASVHIPYGVVNEKVGP